MNSTQGVTISVVIPTHDRPDLLMEAVESVRSQTRQPDEVIIVDNGATPATIPPDCLPNLRIVEIEPHSGAAKARNVGVATSTCHYTAFLDDDDLWSPGYLEAVQVVLESHEPDYVIGRLDLLKGDEVIRYRELKSTTRLLDAVWVTNPGVGGPNSTVKRETFVRLGGYDTDLITSEDRSLIAEFLLADALVVTAPEAVAIARDHQGDRLTDPKRMAEGKRRFMGKYSNRMPTWARIRNRAVIAFQSWRVDRNPLRLFETAAFVVAAKVVRLVGPR